MPAKTADQVVPEMLANALRHHQAGRLAEAEQLYRQVLTVEPEHVDALHLFGVLARQAGRPDAAVEYIGKAIRLKDDVPSFYSNLGTALQDQGKLLEALAQYERAVVLNPDYAEAYINMGNVFKAQGDADQAIANYERGLLLKPNYAETHNNLGTVLKSQGKLDAAIVCYRRALALRPDYADAHYNLGNVFKSQGKLDDATASFERAITANPDHTQAYINTGAILHIQGKLDASITCYKRALSLKPDYAETHYNLGNVLRDQGKLSDAASCFQQAISLNPDFVDAHLNFGQTLQQLDRFYEAATSYERALALKPDSADILSNLGSLSADQGKSDEAIEFYKRALALKPELAYVHNNVLLTMVYMASVSPQKLASAAREFGQRVAYSLLRPRPLFRNVDPARKLRVGYVSYDLREHAVSYFIEPLLQLHDPSQFELFAYSNSTPVSEDHITARLKQNVEHWRNISALSDDEAADLIEADAIDILVDLAGHTAGNRLLVFARKPAPVQVTWLGYPATTGMKAMDYRITDVHAEPPGMTEHLNTETLWRLPQIFCCYKAHENSPHVIDHPPFEDNGYITFGCFNNFSKVTDVVLAAWRQILAQVPDSRLLLEIRGVGSPIFRREVETRLVRAGIPLDRVILEPRKRSNQYVLYNKIDIALDPFPCAGGTTSMDTMWMGVPFITLAGEHFVSRMGVTILTNANMPELIADSVDEYVALATRLALDSGRLRSLRHNLRDKVAASPLMDHSAFTRNMEAAYREMWREWCDSAPKI